MFGAIEDEVVRLIREVGIDRLGRFDGCICCHFEVQNVSVDISCGKGEPRGVRVSSGSADYYNGKELDIGALQLIADEVARQAFERDGGWRGQIPAIVVGTAESDNGCKA